MRAIRAVYGQNRAGVPDLVWNPELDRLIAPPLRFLMEHWSGLKGEAALPHRKQIDPVDLRPALGYVMLLDPVDDGRDFRYRLYGSVVAGVSGFDMTGKLVSEIRASFYVAEFAIATYRALLQRRAPVYTERSPLGALQTTIWQRLALPLVDDSGAVTRLLAGTVPIGRNGRIIRSPF